MFSALAKRLLSCLHRSRLHALVVLGGRVGVCVQLMGPLNMCVHASTQESSTPPAFLGSLSCSSSSCHGGAATNKDQYLIWSRQDFHSRAYATLTTARSKRLAEVLRINDAA